MNPKIQQLRRLAEGFLLVERPHPRACATVADLLDAASVEIVDVRASDDAHRLAHAFRRETMERHVDNSEAVAPRLQREIVHQTLGRIADEWEVDWRIAGAIAHMVCDFERRIRP